MKPNNEIPIFQRKKEFYDLKYQWALDLVDQQNGLIWAFDETNIPDDYDDLHTNLNQAEIHGITKALSLFTGYEMDIGNDYWNGVVAKVFGHPEIKMLATTNAYFEVIHARAYNEINKVMSLDTKEFYTAYLYDQPLKERMDFIENACRLPKNWNALDVLKSLATFLFIEGAILFTSFAYIKHFSANGKNLLKNTNAAIDYSIRDEGNIHVTSTEYLFKTLLVEAELTTNELNELELHAKRIAYKTYEHEEIIMDRLFEKGEPEGITAHDMKVFIKDRINECLGCLNYLPVFEPDKFNVIRKWFYDNISTLKLTDFFVKQSAQYTKDWNRSKFIWKTNVE